MFAGLQDLGVANGEDLKETLTNCTEPLKAIEQFQVEPGGGAGWRGRASGCESGVGRGRVGKRADFSPSRSLRLFPGLEEPSVLS